MTKDVLGGGVASGLDVRQRFNQSLLFSGSQGDRLIRGRCENGHERPFLELPFGRVTLPFSTIPVTSFMMEKWSTRGSVHPLRPRGRCCRWRRRRVRASASLLSPKAACYVAFSGNPGRNCFHRLVKTYAAGRAGIRLGEQVIRTTRHKTTADRASRSLGRDNEGYAEGNQRGQRGNDEHRFGSILRQECGQAAQSRQHETDK